MDAGLPEETALLGLQEMPVEQVQLKPQDFSLSTELVCERGQSTPGNAAAWRPCWELALGNEGCELAASNEASRLRVLHGLRFGNPGGNVWLINQEA